MSEPVGNSEPKDDAEPVAAIEEAAQGAADARGMRALTSSSFSLTDSIGGVRGLIEALAPGIVFVVVYVVTRELTPTLIASMGVALVAVALRLIQRTPLTQALSGVLGVGIGVIWAWFTKDANDYFAFGLLTNAAYMILCLVSVLIGWPAVGLIVELLKGGSPSAESDTERGASATSVTASEPAAAEKSQSTGIGVMLTAWRADRQLVRRYAAATWLWVGLFGVRLLVQLPLFLDGNEVGWLGTARLVMGVPLWALTLWLTWVLVRKPEVAATQPHPHPDR